STLNRLYVLTTSYTASASEMIINGLRPYMDVVVVGGTTVGKNEGSITVYASAGDLTHSETRNTNHKVGKQPNKSQIFNSANESNYDDGFTPDLAIDEGNFAATIKPFGDQEEVLLKTAVDDITGMSARQSLSSSLGFTTAAKVKGKKFSTAMYMLPSD